jgi:hypothetical protein
MLVTKMAKIGAMQLRGSILCAPLLFLSLAANPHHSTSFNYSDETVTLDGTISNLKWINPHSSLVLSLIKDDGTIEEYLVEFLARIALERGGFDFDAFQNGMMMNITGRIGFREGHLRFREAILADGRVIRERSPTATDENGNEVETRVL